MTPAAIPMKVPFFNYPALFAAHQREYMTVIEQVLHRGAYIMQQELAEFEAALAAYVKVRHAIGVADGTMALLIGLRAAGVKPGDEVIVPSHTFVASAAAISHAGAVPVLADCGTDHLIDAASARRQVTARTRAIMPVQLNGRACDMDAVGALAREHGLAIVEDSCQALGSTFGGRCAGTFGAAGAFSFYPSKTLGCFGDGGALVTDDNALADAARNLRDHGRSASGEVTAWGYNSRLDNLQAAVLLTKLRRYEAEIARRRELAARYRERLSALPQLILPPGPEPSDARHFDIFQNYEIEAERRDDLRAHLTGAGIGTLLQWGGWMLHQHRALALRGEWTNTERLRARYLMLPMNTSLRDEDVDFVCDQIMHFYG